MDRNVDVTQLLEGLQAGRQPALPHLAELAEAFVREAGGTEAMARQLWQQYLDSPQGSVARAQLFGLIQRIWKYATESMQIDEPEALSDTELDAEIRRTILEILADAAQTSRPAVG